MNLKGSHANKGISRDPIATRGEGAWQAAQGTAPHSSEVVAAGNERAIADAAQIEAADLQPSGGSLGSAPSQGTRRPSNESADERAGDSPSPGLGTDSSTARVPGPLQGKTQEDAGWSPAQFRELAPTAEPPAHTSSSLNPARPEGISPALGASGVSFAELRAVYPGLGVLMDVAGGGW